MKRFMILMLFMLLLVACEEEGPPDEIIVVSDTPYLVYVALNTETEGQVLVPQGKVMAVGDVDSVTFQYEVSLYSTEITNGFMAVEAIDVLIDGSDEYAHLVQITIMDEVGKKLLPVFEYSIIVSIVVEILEPIDEAEAIENEWDLSVVNVEDSQAAFEAIFGKSITFDVSFELINIE